jgi:murein DD-endopeptidase MepM/ murein hydrolase activator NlpD
VRRDDVCQDGAVVRHRGFTASTVLALTLTLAVAGCGGPNADADSASTPVFVTPTTESARAPEPAPSSVAPSSAAPSSSPSASTTPKPSRSASAAAPATAGDVTYVFPVKASNVAFHPTHGKYPATDIFADCGEKVVATTDGVVLEVSRTDGYVKGQPDGPLNGGLSVSLLGDDGVRYYGSHLSRIQAGINAGVRVKGGQQLGLVGRTGNANNVCHLHFGISPPCARTGDWKVRRGVVWPATYLTSWRKQGAKSPVATVAAWKKSHNCKA